MLFISGISWETTDHKLRDVSAQCGRVLQATVVLDELTAKLTLRCRSLENGDAVLCHTDFSSPLLKKLIVKWLRLAISRGIYLLILVATVSQDARRICC